MPEVRGLYALTPDELDTGRLLRLVGEVIAAGARLVQYRNKQAPPSLRLVQALGLHAMCQKAGVPLIINDDVELALETEAEGVHLGREDGDLRAARSRLGAKRLLGVSCYNELEAAHRAVAAGGDYVAFGAAFPSGVKPSAVRAPLELYARAKRELGVPVVAIGGIDRQNARLLAEAGVDAVAVISGVFGEPDVAGSAAAIARLWD
ncbi:thiamine-phosphate pyrophosphorylase [Burkholderiales bacterium]|nr:MAG: thiamine phosphate synthase [Burkholderiales bacterium]CAG1011541.1 thiamine-phosphate pyrophosphorylase [Burkholderiales bacterium]